MTVTEGFYTNTLMNLSVEFNYNYSQYSESSASGNISGTLYLDNFQILLIATIRIAVL